MNLEVSEKESEEGLKYGAMSPTLTTRIGYDTGLFEYGLQAPLRAFLQLPTTIIPTMTITIIMRTMNLEGVQDL